MDTIPIVLEYCGGTHTDTLVERLRNWNPKHDLYVLDNNSPRYRSKYITHQNPVNTDTGGGIRDCLRIAKTFGARFLLFIVNDIECTHEISFAYFEKLASSDQRIVQVSASITADSAQAKPFPW